jgi:hypothetical protein
MPTIKPLLRVVRPDDADYFRARAIQEQIAAQKATCEAARKRHDELAAMYRFRALMLPDGLESEPGPVRTRTFETVS